MKENNVLKMFYIVHAKTLTILFYTQVHTTKNFFDEQMKFVVFLKIKVLTIH